MNSSLASAPSDGAAVVTTARGPIEVVRVGKGPAVLFVHGMPGSWRQALPLAEDIAGAHQSILVSRPGYGRTPLTSGRTAAEQADLLAALLDEIGVDDAAVVGISGGGPSTVSFAQRHPERTRRVVLLCALAPHLMSLPRYARIAVAVPGVALVASAVDRLRTSHRVKDRERLLARYRRDLPAVDAARLATDPTVADEVVAYYDRRRVEPSWHAGMRNDVVQLLRASAPPPTHAVTAPVTIVHGGADTVVTVAHAEHHAQTLPGAGLHVIDGAGHGLTIVHRSRLVELIREH